MTPKTARRTPAVSAGGKKRRAARVLPVISMAVSEIQGAEYNPRKISKEAAAGLAASLERFGLVEPLVWNRRTKRLVGGHQRLEALRASGAKRVPVTVVDLSEPEERALNVTLNNPQIAGEWSADAVGFLEGIAGSVGAEVFGDLRLDDLLKELGAGEAEISEDEIPEPPKKPVTKQGDLWTLGRHRLLCGDATTSKNVGRLLGDAKPNLMVTDPPYGVEYDPEWRERAGHAVATRGKLENDDRADWSEAWALFPGNVAYVWHASIRAGEVYNSLEGSGFKVRAQIIWAKPTFALSRGDYHFQHEPCWYAVRRGEKSRWAGDRSQTTLWSVSNTRRNEDAQTSHTTQKPVAVVAKPFANHEAPEVYEPFAGSGTAFVAAEQLDRSCFGLELDPRYCDVIVERWQNLTGQKASRN